MLPPDPHVDACRLFLDLPEAACTLLMSLARAELGPEAYGELQAGDERGREGVLSWAALQSLASPDDAAAAVHALSSWGLLQIVGIYPEDPLVPGSAALRLTYWGRAAAGMTPPGRQATPQTETIPWLILHGEPTEALLVEALSVVGRIAPLRVTAAERIPFLCGHVAAKILEEGAVMVDATSLATESLPDLGGLLMRTSRARAPRVLLLNDPEPIRYAALLAGARLQWVFANDGATRLSGALTRMLREQWPASDADLCGVPSARVARPRQVSVKLEELQVSPATARRLQLVLLHARARIRAFGRGYRLLLSGLPGTGKSMTAAVVATFLGLPLIKLDLSSVLSKWLGETEKLLGEIFEMAETSGSLLVLDEAEALFRQRDTGPGGSQALATAVAYLLGRLDDFRGALVATTNRAEDLDEAFFRRFDDYLVLPLPDVPTRRLLWAQKLGSTDNLDLDLLAHRFSISGGLIEGAALRARAWAENGAPDMVLVLASLVLELEKNHLPADDIYTTPWGDAVRNWVGGSVP